MSGTMSRSGGFRAALGAGAVMLLLAAPAQAGPIFFPGEMEGGKFVPAAGPSQGYCARYSSATSTAGDDQATVQVEDLIDGHDTETRAVCLIPLPVGTDGGDIRVTLGVPGGKPI